MTHEAQRHDESPDATGLPESAEPGRPAPAPAPGPLRRHFEGAVSRARFLFLIPVVVLLLTAAGSFVYGASIFVQTAASDLGQVKQTGGRLGTFLVILDTFLVGATLVVVAVGFYELFVIRPSAGTGNQLLPGWLRMRDLDDLKARVVSMLILVSAITFADILVDQHGGGQTFFTGLAVAVIILALTAFLRFGRDRDRGDRNG